MQIALEALASFPSFFESSCPSFGSILTEFTAVDITVIVTAIKIEVKAAFLLLISKVAAVPLKSKMIHLLQYQ